MWVLRASATPIIRWNQKSNMKWKLGLFWVKVSLYLGIFLGVSYNQQHLYGVYIVSVSFENFKDMIVIS